MATSSAPRKIAADSFATLMLGENMVLRFFLLSLLFIALPFIGVADKVMKWAYAKNIVKAGPGKASLFDVSLLALLMSLSTIAIMVWVGFLILK